MAARQAKIINLADYRQQRQPQAAAPQAAPVVWFPMWFMVPVWRLC